MMDQRWFPTLNEREFIEQAFESGLRVDGRGPFDFRNLKIAFGRYLGSIPFQSLLPSFTIGASATATAYGCPPLRCLLKLLLDSAGRMARRRWSSVKRV
jgi:hypothetical protein